MRGAVAVIQRFGGALNLNLHVHALVLDGVFARDRAGVVVFHATPRLDIHHGYPPRGRIPRAAAPTLSRSGVG